MVDKIADQLRIERHTQRMTLDELSLKSGVSAKHLCNIENGKTRPTLETLQKIAKSLGVRISIELTNISEAPQCAVGE